MKSSNEKAETALTSIVSYNPSLNDTVTKPQQATHHLEEFAKSGISQEIAATAFESVESSQALLNRNNEPGAGWKAIAVDPKTGIVIEQLISFKPDNKQGKQKYLMATGSKADAICLKMPDRDYWLKVAFDKTQPIFITEGAKKAASLLSRGYAAIALPGITNYKQKDTKTPLPNVLPFLQAGRNVYLIPDSDFKTNKTVALAVADNIGCLQAYRVNIKVLEWNETQGKGIDDVIVTASDKDIVARLMETALTVEEFKLVLKTFESEYLFNDQMESLEQAVLRVINKQHPKTYFRANAQWLVKKDGALVTVVKDEEVKLVITSILSQLFTFTNKGDRRQNYSTQSNIKNCYEGFKDYCEVNSKFESRPENLNFPNGVFNTDTDNFRPRTEDDLSLVNLPYSYNPNAKCPDDIYSFWVEKFADTRFTREQQEEQLQALIRFYLDCSEDSHFEHFVHIQGKQGSGKGLFCQMIGALYSNDNVSHIDNLSYLSEATKAQDYLAGEKRLCLGTEIHSHIEDQSGFYKLTVGESVTTRRLFHQTNDKTRYYIRFLLASTSSITTSAKANEGLGRRMIVLKTNGSQGKPTTESGGKINFKALAGEYASWALQMSRKKMEEVLRELQAANADEAVLNYNPIALFVTECFERVNDANRRHSTTQSVTLKQMYDYYSAWAIYSKAPGFGKKKFSERLQETIDILYQKEKTERINGKVKELPRRFIGLKVVFELINDRVEPNQLNPSALLEGQTLTDLLREIDSREPEAINYSQQALEVKPVNYSPATANPNEVKAITVESDDLAF